MTKTSETANGITPKRLRKAHLFKISDIVVGTRHRKDMGDIAGLAASIAELGLLHHPTPPRARPKKSWLHFGRRAVMRRLFAANKIWNEPCGRRDRGQFRIALKP